MAIKTRFSVYVTPFKPAFMGKFCSNFVDIKATLHTDIIVYLLYPKTHNWFTGTFKMATIEVF